MFSTLNVLAASGSASSGPPALANLGLLVVMGLIFWFLVFRPQIKRQKTHQAKIADLKKGDQVVTGGGLVGKVIKLDEHYVEVELAQGVRVKAVRHTLSDVLLPGGSAPAND